MARNEVFISAPPQAVFDVLSQPETYCDWVVGTEEIRGADPEYPSPGARLHHSVGKRPLLIRDETQVIDAEPPVLLKLEARARPLPSATIVFHLQPEGNGTRLTMIEAPSRRLLSVLAGPLGHGAIALRNRETLRRLKEIAEGAREADCG